MTATPGKGDAVYTQQELIAVCAVLDAHLRDVKERVAEGWFLQVRMQRQVLSSGNGVELSKGFALTFVVAPTALPSVAGVPGTAPAADGTGWMALEDIKFRPLVPTEETEE